MSLSIGLHGSLNISLQFMNRGANCLCSELSFQGNLKSLRRQRQCPLLKKDQEGLMSSIVKTGRQWLPLCIEQACLLPIIKELGSQAQRSSSVTHHIVCIGINWPSLHHPVRIGAWRMDKNAATLSTVLCLWSRSLLHQDPWNCDELTYQFASRVHISTSSSLLNSNQSAAKTYTLYHYYFILVLSWSQLCMYAMQAVCLELQ